LQPVASLVISRAEAIDDSFIGNSCEILWHLLVRSLWKDKVQFAHASQCVFCLLNQSYIDICRLSALENRIASVYPLYGGAASHVNFLGLEAPGAAIHDYTVPRREAVIP